MKTRIGKFDAATGTVPVRFEHDGKVHKRPVNAVLKEDGTYDATATAERVEQVATGVEHKFALGLLGEAD
jgi:hypothetical protein